MPPPRAPRAPARAHAAVVCTLVWYRDALEAQRRGGAADRLRRLSARLVRNAPRCPVTGAAIDALAQAVRELARRAWIATDW